MELRAVLVRHMPETNENKAFIGLTSDFVGQLISPATTLLVNKSLSKHIKASFAAGKANRTFHRLASPNPIWELVTESAVGKSQFSGPSAKYNPPFSVHTDCPCSQLNVKQIMNIHFQISI